MRDRRLAVAVGAHPRLHHVAVKDAEPVHGADQVQGEAAAAAIYQAAAAADVTEPVLGIRGPDAEAGKSPLFQYLTRSPEPELVDKSPV